MTAITTIATPYLLFLGDAADDLAAKTAIGIRDWRPELCRGQLRLPGCVPDLQLPEMTPAEAHAAGVKSMVLGVANAGGVIPDHWIVTILAALEAGLDIANGLHTRLIDIPEVALAAARLGRKLHDVRHSHAVFKTGTGRPRAGLRLLTVGTDCSVGKMYTALAIEKEMRARGMNADFRATGQTGILIAGRGVAVDAVIADFIAGATEALAPANSAGHWDVIEGQGSLFHPAFAGVTLGLIHGSQPDVIVLCHEPTRSHMRGLPDMPAPGLQQCLEANLAAARLTNPAVRCAGIAVNTARLDDAAARSCLADLGRRFDLPAVDPVRTGVGPIVDLIQSGPLA